MNSTLSVRRLPLLLSVGALMAGATPATVAEPFASDDWQFAATVYFWAAGIDSETAGGAETSISFDTLLDNLNMSFMGSFEARRGKWSALADVIYLNAGVNGGGTVPVRRVADPGTVVDVGASVKTRGWVSQVLGGYNLWQTPEASLDVVAGIRYLELDLDFGLGLAAGSYAVSTSLTPSGILWDGVIGVRGYAELDSRWYIPFHLDAGAGDSDFTWQASLGLGYRFDWGDISLVYRHIAWDAGSGSPLDHIDFSGPLLGAKFRF